MDEEGPNIFESHTVVQSQLQDVYYSPQDFADYKFVVSYFVELVLSYLIYYPIAGTILFSGVLSCGKWQVTGGRPYELQQLALQQQQIMEEEEGVEVEWESKRSGAGNNNSSDDQEEYTNGVESCSSGREEEHSDSPPSDEEEGHGSIHHHHHPEEDQREQDVMGVEISKDGV
eukprot:Sro1257_g256740.2  (173) ;mRNA; r:17871-18389